MVVYGAKKCVAAAVRRTSSSAPERRLDRGFDLIVAIVARDVDRLLARRVRDHCSSLHEKSHASYPKAAADLGSASPSVVLQFTSALAPKKAGLSTTALAATSSHVCVCVENDYYMGPGSGWSLPLVFFLRPRFRLGLSLLFLRSFMSRPRRRRGC